MRLAASLTRRRPSTLAAAGDGGCARVDIGGPIDIPQHARIVHFAAHQRPDVEHIAGAAIAAQRGIRERFAGSEVPIRIRIGINAGEPIEEDGDLHGTSVVIAKRLESAADHGGILVSDVVKQMVTGKDFDFEDRGPVQLKGFDEPVHAWAVRW